MPTLSWRGTEVKPGREMLPGTFTREELDILLDRNPLGIIFMKKNDRRYPALLRMIKADILQAAYSTSHKGFRGRVMDGYTLTRKGSDHLKAVMIMMRNFKAAGQYKESSMSNRDAVEKMIDQMIGEASYPPKAQPTIWRGPAKKWASAYLYSWARGFGSGKVIQHQFSISIKPGMTYEQALRKAMDENGQDLKYKRDFWLVLMLDADPEWLTSD